MRIGIYQAYWGQFGGGQRYVGAAAQVLARHHAVELVHHCEGFDPAVVGAALELDLARVKFRYVPRCERPSWGPANPLRRYRLERDWQADISRPYDLFIDNSDSVPFFCHAPRGVLITHFPLVRFEEFHGHQTRDWRSRSLLSRLLSGSYHRLEWRRRLATYGLVLTCSEFSRGWLKALWGRDAVVVYPPVRGSFRPAEKSNLILGIGAFHHRQHKKHNVLIETFARLCDAGLAGWELALAGGYQPTEENQHYLDGLRAQAGGHPVTFHPNASAAVLRSLLERAAVFWHAMGYGVDQQADPARLEHFGMVATEAMAAGCVPVLFDGGGLRESVAHGKNGFLWRTLDELGTCTLQAIHDAPLRSRLSAAARARAAEFDEQTFANRLLDVLTPVLAERGAA
jgi:glycosyltransferase involved in cell wall biosynthesis